MSQHPFIVTFLEEYRWECTVAASNPDEAEEMAIANFAPNRTWPDEIDGYQLIEQLPLYIEDVDLTEDLDLPLFPSETGGAR